MMDEQKFIAGLARLVEMPVKYVVKKLETLDDIFSHCIWEAKNESTVSTSEGKFVDDRFSFWTRGDENPLVVGYRDVVSNNQNPQVYDDCRKPTLLEIGSACFRNVWKYAMDPSSEFKVRWGAGSRCIDALENKNFGREYPDTVVYRDILQQSRNELAHEQFQEFLEMKS